MESHDPNQGRDYNGADDGNGWRRFAKEATDAYEQGAGSGSGIKDPQCGDTGTDLPDFYFEKMTDRTNVDTLVAYFTQSMQESEWRDTEGKIIDSVNTEGANAMVHAMLQTMYKTASSPQAFLINLAALAGSTTLVTSRPKCTRLGEDENDFIYKCEWEYRFGEVKGGFTFEQKVPQSMWSRFKKKDAHTDYPDDEQKCAEHWQNKYLALISEMKKREEGDTGP